MICLILSGLIANGIHGYLLYSQRDLRQWSISLHAAKNRKTYVQYLIAHLFAGGLFVLFARGFFTPVLLKILFIGVAAEYLQAIIPAKDKYEKWHNNLAFVMTFSIIAVAVGSVFAFDLPVLARVAALLIAIVTAVGGVAGLILALSESQHKMRFWVIQTIGLPLFYLEMAIIYLTRAGG